MSLNRSKETLARLYHEEGLSLVDLGELYQRSPGTVWGWFKKHNIPTRTVKEAVARKENIVTEKERAIMKFLYLQGLSSNDVAEDLGRDGRLVRTHLKSMGVLRKRTEAVRLAVDNGKIRAKDMQVNDYFFNELTKESAWVLGLIYGDGHVSNRDKTSQYLVYLAGSEEVCRKVAVLIGHERGPSLHNQGADCWILHWSSRRMVKFLEERYSITGKKSRTIRLPLLPEDTLPHFLRGYWDADGSWRRRGSYLGTKLTTASKGMADDLMALFGARGLDPKYYFVETTLNGKRFNHHVVRLNAEPTRRFASWLYDEAVLEIRCSRKSSMISNT